MDGFGDRAGAIGLVPALEELGAELDDPTSDRVVEVLVVAAERGGSIVPELLAELAGSLTRDAWMAEEIETASLEHRINAWAVFALPWLVLAVLTARGGPFREFYASTGGVLVVLAGGLASGGGMAWVLGLDRAAPEARVFRRAER
jgi:tight adherence protein B